MLAQVILYLGEKNRKYLTYHGFEPDKRSRDKLLKKGNNCKSYIIHDKIVSNKLSEKKFIYKNLKTPLLISQTDGLQVLPLS